MATIDILYRCEFDAIAHNSLGAADKPRHLGGGEQLSTGPKCF